MQTLCVEKGIIMFHPMLYEACNSKYYMHYAKKQLQTKTKQQQQEQKPSSNNNNNNNNNKNVISL